MTKTVYDDVKTWYLTAAYILVYIHKLRINFPLQTESFISLDLALFYVWRNNMHPRDSLMIRVSAWGKTSRSKNRSVKGEEFRDVIIKPLSSERLHL